MSTWMRWTGLVLMLSGCGLGHRLIRFPTRPTYVAPPPEGELAAVSVESDGRLEPYQTDRYNLHLARPIIISEEMSLHIKPLEGPVTLRLLIRNDRFNARDFEEISTVTGARDREWVDEIRYIPRTLSTPYRLPVGDLSNIYNEYRFLEGDLLLIEVSSKESTDRYLFINRPVGLYGTGAFDVSVRTSLPPDDEVVLSPAFMVGLAFGYRVRDYNSKAAKIIDPLALQVSVGIGSSALEAAQEADNLSTTLGEAFISSLGGVGIRGWDVVSVQVIVNLQGVFNRNVGVVPALGVGVDAGQLADLTRDAFEKIIQPNPLSPPPPPSGQ